MKILVEIDLITKECKLISTTKLNASDIAHIIFEYFGINIESKNRGTNKNKYQEAKRLASYFICDIFKYSQYTAAKELNLDRTTINWHLKRCREFIELKDKSILLHKETLDKIFEIKSINIL